MRTWAPGMEAPVESWMVPETWEVETACGQTAGAIPKRQSKNRIDRTLIGPPFVGLGETAPARATRRASAPLMLASDASIGGRTVQRSNRNGTVTVDTAGRGA